MPLSSHAQARAQQRLGTLGLGDGVRLLFTSQPKPDKTQYFVAALQPVVDAQADRGDVCLVFKDGSWTTSSHAIAP